MYLRKSLLNLQIKNKIKSNNILINQSREKKYQIFSLINKPFSYDVDVHYINPTKKEIDFTPSYKNRTKIPFAIIEDNFKKLIWHKKYKVIHKEINIEDIFNEKDEKILMEKNKKILIKLLANKILLELMKNTNNQNNFYIVNKMLNESFITIVNIFTKEYTKFYLKKNYEFLEENFEENFFKEICYFFTEIDYINQDNYLHLTYKEILKLVNDINDDNEFNEFYKNSLENLLNTQKNSFNKTEINFIKKEILKKNKTKNEAKKKQNKIVNNNLNDKIDFDKRKNYLDKLINREFKKEYNNNMQINLLFNLRLTEIITFCIITKKINIEEMFKILINENIKSNKSTNFKDLNYESQYKIILFSLNIIKDFYLIADFIHKNNKNNTSEKSKEEIFFDKNQLFNYEDHIRNLMTKKKTKFYSSKNFFEIFYTNKINKLSENINSLQFEINECQKLLLKMAKKLIKISYLFPNKENLFNFNTQIISNIILIELKNQKFSTVNIFFEFLENFLKLKNLRKIDPVINFDIDNTYKSFINILKIFEIFFEDFKQNDNGKELLLKENNKKIIEFYFKFFENFCENLYAKINNEKILSDYQINLIQKFHKIANRNFAQYDFLNNFIENEKNKWEFRSGILVMNMIFSLYFHKQNNEKQGILKRDYIMLTKFKLIVFNFYVLFENLTERQMEFLFDCNYEKFPDNSNNMRLFEFLEEVLDDIYCLFEKELNIERKQDKNLLKMLKKVLEIVLLKVNLLSQKDEFKKGLSGAGESLIDYIANIDKLLK